MEPSADAPPQVVDDTPRRHLSQRQISSLRGIIDALLPSLEPPENSKQSDGVVQFWTTRLSTNQDFISALEETILYKLLPMQSWLLGLLLYLLSTWWGTSLVFGALSWNAFCDLKSPSLQTQALQSLQKSSWTAKRQIFSSIKRLVCGLACSFVPKQDKSSVNPFWPGIGYPGPNIKPQTQEKQQIRDFRSEKNVMVEVKQDLKLTYDVVIVGSGAGGGVAAATLAAKGFSVLIIEKAAYQPPSNLSNYEAEAFDTMYESHGLLTTSDQNISILAGSTLGGGTTINWSCCLALPDHVRKEWIHANSIDGTKTLQQFEEGQEFDVAMEFITKRIGCHDKSHITHNKANQRLMRGCQRLQYKWETTGQNLKSTKDERTGYICFGDLYGNKQSGLVTFLADAVDCGAQILDNCRVEQVLQGLYKAPGGQRRRRALGVMGRVGPHKMTVQAQKCVIMAAGALNTPCLLQQSWLRNKHIGRHLHLHPVIAASGFYDEVIDCYHGAPMTTVCQEFHSGPLENGYGAKIECPSAHPGLLASGLQFVNPHHYREHALKIRRVLPLIVLQRDTSEGRVCVDQDGYTPRIDYSINDEDKQSMLATLKGVIKVLLASGAKEVLSGHCSDPGFQRPESLGGNATKSEIEDNAELQEYFRQIDERGFRDHEMSVFVAHQMGSCRMSTSPETGVVDENGETWEVDDLFVFDTSTFPTASGANPMLTVLAMSRMLSTRLVLRLLHEDEKLPGVAPEARHAMDVLRLLRLRVPQQSRSLFTSILLFLSASLVIASVVWVVWRPQFLQQADTDGEL